MTFVARKDTRSSSSHYERHITKINTPPNLVQQRKIQYKKFGVSDASKKYISDSPGKADFLSVNCPDWT